MCSAPSVKIPAAKAPTTYQPEKTPTYSQGPTAAPRDGTTMSSTSGRRSTALTGGSGIRNTGVTGKKTLLGV